MESWISAIITVNYIGKTDENKYVLKWMLMFALFRKEKEVKI